VEPFSIDALSRRVGFESTEPREEQGDATAMLPCADNGASIELKDVTFAFPGRDPVLQRASLKVQAGERVALRGVSGSGRSALLDVLVGLRDPQRGRVEIDGLDVGDVHTTALRKRAAVVRGAEVVIGSIFENVAFGRGLDHHRVREALEAVALLDAVAALPDGLATEIHSTGAPLSHGQAIRLVLARAMVGRPSLLIVDRCLDGLDPGTRSRVLDSLYDPEAPWTLLVVTDDPEVSGRCGRAVVVEGGRLREEVA
jgi:ABC-type bacteriocin/lantibiotic exporter with double-glycine peptidase domain